MRFFILRYKKAADEINMLLPEDFIHWFCKLNRFKSDHRLFHISKKMQSFTTHSCGIFLLERSLYKYLYQIQTPIE